MTDTDPDGATVADRGLSRWSLATVVAVVGAAALVLALAAFGIDSLREDRPRATEGQVFESSMAPEEPLGGAGTVFLPWARLSVAVGEPRDELPRIESVESDVAPPEGGSFVRVEAGDSEEDEEVPLIGIRDSPDFDARVVLVADGVEYPLDGPDGLDLDPADPSWSSEPAARWVAVPGEPTDLAVEVVVDGQVQTVDGDGDVTRRRAQGLADVPSYDSVGSSHQSSCGTARRDDESSLRFEGLSTCEITAGLRTPYVNGLGWVPEGREYLAVEVHHDLLPKGTEDGLEWEMSVEADGLLGDRRPAGRMSPGRDTVFSQGVRQWQPDLVFEVPAGEPADDLTLRLDVEAVLDDPFTDDERARFEWTIPGRSLP